MFLSEAEARSRSQEPGAGAVAGSRNRSWSRLDRLHNTEDMRRETDDGRQEQCCGAGPTLTRLLIRQLAPDLATGSGSQLRITTFL